MLIMEEGTIPLLLLNVEEKRAHLWQPNAIKLRRATVNYALKCPIFYPCYFVLLYLFLLKFFWETDWWQAIYQVLGVGWLFLFRLHKKGPDSLTILSIAIGFISLLIGELGSVYKPFCPPRIEHFCWWWFDIIQLWNFDRPSSQSSDSFEALLKCIIHGNSTFSGMCDTEWFLSSGNQRVSCKAVSFSCTFIILDKNQVLLLLMHHFLFIN